MDEPRSSRASMPPSSPVESGVVTGPVEERARIDLTAVRRDITRASDPAVQGEGRRVVTGRVVYAASVLVDEVERLQDLLAAADAVDPLRAGPGRCEHGASDPHSMEPSNPDAEWCDGPEPAGPAFAGSGDAESPIPWFEPRTPDERGHIVMADGWCTMCECWHPDVPIRARHEFPPDQGAGLAALPSVVYAGANRYDTDDTSVLHLWTADGRSFDVMWPKAVVSRG